MKWFLLYLTVFCYLQAQQVLYFQEKLGAPVYKKCMFQEQNGRQKLTEEFYFLNEEQRHALLRYKQKIFFYKNRPTKQIFENYETHKTTIIEVKKDEITVHRDEKKITAFDKPKNFYFVNSAKMYHHPMTFQVGKSFSVHLFPTPTQNRFYLVKHNVKILPKSELPNQKGGKKYFVAQISEASKKGSVRKTFYDSNRNIVYSTAKIGKISASRKRIKAKKNLIFSKYHYKVQEAEPRAPIACEEDVYSHSYPQNWDRVSLPSFKTAYKGDSGTVGVVSATNEDDIGVFVPKLLKKLKSSSPKQSYNYQNMIDYETRTIVVGVREFQEFIFKCTDGDQYKFFLVLAAADEKQKFAIIVYGTEKQFKKNWPTWYDIMHSFVLKTKES